MNLDRLIAIARMSFWCLRHPREALYLWRLAGAVRKLTPQQRAEIARRLDAAENEDQLAEAVTAEWKGVAG